MYSNWNNTLKTSYTNWNYRKVNRNNSKYSAGILPYTFDLHGNCFFLLGKDNDGDWSDFGGRCELKDNLDEKNTASREFYEETLGSVLSINECIDRLRPENKIISKTLNGSPYYMFLVYVEHLNYSEHFVKISNFIKYQHFNDTKSLLKIVEKTSMRWVTLDTLISCVENKQKDSPISLRGVFYKTIENCKEHLVLLK